MQGQICRNRGQRRSWAYLGVPESSQPQLSLYLDESINRIPSEISSHHPVFLVGNLYPSFPILPLSYASLASLIAPAPHIRFLQSLKTPQIPNPNFAGEMLVPAEKANQWYRLTFKSFSHASPYHPIPMSFSSFPTESPPCDSSCRQIILPRDNSVSC